jgi:hypothetical protein
VANMKTDDSGIITTECFTGRCPVRCEMCFVNFGEGGSSVPFGIYSSNGVHQFNYANCRTTMERLRKDRKRGEMDWFANALCGPDLGLAGDNNRPRKWTPVVGVDVDTGRPTPFRADMRGDDYLQVLKPLGDDPGLFSIPKVPEAPWFRFIEATRTFNGQWTPSILRVNSMSDSSVAPTEWCEQILDIWGDRCFFNSNIHAISRYPANLRSGVYHKLVVTANPGLQKLHAGLDRYKLYHPTPEDMAQDPDMRSLAREMGMGDVASLTDGERDGLITLRLGAGTMKGTAERRWHFYNPWRLMDLDPSYEQYEANIKFYRVRGLPTIQPDVSKFDGPDVPKHLRKPVVYTVLRFKTVAQTLEFARKYDIEADVITKSVQDKVVCDYYGVRNRMAEEGEAGQISLRSDSPLNASPNRGEWTILHYYSNFYRAGKEQMGEMEFVCDRASMSCKACGLCAMLDATEPNWENPYLAELGFKLKRFDKQASYVCNAKGDPVKTPGIVGRVGNAKKMDMTPVAKGLGRTQSEMDFFNGPGMKKYWTVQQMESAKKDKLRAKKRQEAKRKKNPAALEEIPEPAEGMMAILDSFSVTGRRRNPDALEESLAKSLKTVADYSTQADGEWVQGWDTHEQVASLVAYVFWWLMVLAHQEGLNKDEAVEDARAFSYGVVGMDLFEDNLTELSLMYNDESNWSDQFGSTR